jgi:hypothetical protein
MCIMSRSSNGSYILNFIDLMVYILLRYLKILNDVKSSTLLNTTKQIIKILW